MKSQRERRLAWVGVALTAVALAFGVTVDLLELLPGVTEANVKRIRRGMTAAEVEAILGRKADESTAFWMGEWPPNVAKLAVWNQGDGFACVSLDREGRVVDKHAERLTKGGNSLKRLRSLLGW